MSNATHVAKIEETVARQRAFFQTGATRPVAVRVAALKRLKKEMGRQRSCALQLRPTAMSARIPGCAVMP